MGLNFHKIVEKLFSKCQNRENHKICHLNKLTLSKMYQILHANYSVTGLLVIIAHIAAHLCTFVSLLCLA